MKTKNILSTPRIIFLSLITCTILSGMPLSAQQKSLTARQVIEQIQQHVGVPWMKETVDVFKAGNPDTPVTGIVTTMFATYDVLQKAVASGCNLIITHEPTFYNHLDKVDDLEKANDEVLADKKAYIEKHGLIIFRFHDHWHMRHPDGIIRGFVYAIGWENYENKGTEALFVIPETTLTGLARELKKKLGITTIRIIGDAKMKVTKVAYNPGAPGSTLQINTLERKDVEVLLIGESPEWETAAYVRDAAAEGKHKAMIILGHVPSEEAGMEECARWMKTFINGVPITFVPSGESYWTIK